MSQIQTPGVAAVVTKPWAPKPLTPTVAAPETVTSPVAEAPVVAKDPHITEPTLPVSAPTPKATPKPADVMVIPQHVILIEIHDGQPKIKFSSTGVPSLHDNVLEPRVINRIIRALPVAYRAHIYPLKALRKD